MAGNASDWISAGSLVVAISALVVSVFANRKANANQQRLVEIEEQRENDRQIQKLSAQLRPELRRTGKGERLVIINQGNAEARNVRVTMDGKPLSEHKASVSNDRLPDMVGANSEISCLLALAMGCTPPFDVDVTWDDDSGDGKRYKTTLTF
jgi:hypothetical protein